MRILQVNYYDNLGGAARIAWLLHQGYRARGHDSWMAVAKKHSNDPFVKNIPVMLPKSPISKPFSSLAQYAEKHNWSSGYRNIAGIFHRLADPVRYWERYTTGKEDFDFPGSRTILNSLSEIPDLVHLHNLHPNYFDLTYLQTLSQTLPPLLTLHDMWLLTGHCAYSLDCEGWKTGCGACPYLKTYPTVHRDNTAYNWQRKQDIFSESKLHIVTPSKWLMNKVEASILASGLVSKKVIPNGIDLKTFHPKSKERARKQLNLPLDKVILLFISASGMDLHSYKDYLTAQSAIEIVARKFDGDNLIFIALGEKKLSQKVGNVEIRYIPYLTSLDLVANYYQAADIYLHAARADNFPNVVLEAQACGTPVIATAIGGIPEQILDGQTGFLTQSENPLDMAERIIQLFADKNLMKSMGDAAGKHAREHFGLDRMIDAYLEYYQEILDN